MLLPFLLAACAAPSQNAPINRGQVRVEQETEVSFDDLDYDYAPTQRNAPKLSEKTENDIPVQPSPVWDVTDADVTNIDPSRKLIALTFDDAPSRTLESIFAVFAAYNEANPDCIASATVFFNGGLFDAQTEHHLHAARALGFELGNHTHSHANLTLLEKEEIEEEIRKTDELLKKADGKPYHLLRTPFGKTNELVRQAAFTPLIDWTIDTLDWTGVSADEIYEGVLSSCFSGAIVLMHDGYQNTVDALKRLLPALKENGYQAVTVSQLSKMHGCPLKRGSVYIRARKGQV